MKTRPLKDRCCSSASPREQRPLVGSAPTGLTAATSGWDHANCPEFTDAIRSDSYGTTTGKPGGGQGTGAASGPQPPTSQLFPGNGHRDTRPEIAQFRPRFTTAAPVGAKGAPQAGDQNPENWARVGFQSMVPSTGTAWVIKVPVDTNCQSELRPRNGTKDIDVTHEELDSCEPFLTRATRERGGGHTTSDDFRLQWRSSPGVWSQRQPGRVVDAGARGLV